MTDSRDDNKKDNVIYLSSAPDNRAYQHYYLKGISSLDKGRLTTAIDSINKALKLNPENWELRLQLVQLLFDDKQYDLARNHLKYLRRKFDGLYIISTYSLGQIYNIIEKYGKAIRCYKQCLKKLSEGFKDEIGSIDEVDVRRELAVSYYNAGRYNKAAFQLLEKIFSRGVLDEKPNIGDVVLLINIIIQSNRKGDSQEEIDKEAINMSLDLLRQKTKENANDHLFHLNLGKFYEIYLNSPSMALHEYRKAYNLSPHDAEVIYNYGRSLQLNGQKQESYDLLYRNRNVLKDKVDHSILIALTAIEVNCLDEAREILERILQEDPQNLEAIIGMGDLEYRSHNYDKAMEYLGKAKKLEANNSRTIFLLGLVYLQKKEDISKAIKQLGLACRLDPENSRYYLHYGDALSQNGQNREAKDAWRKAAELDDQLKESVRARFKRLKNSG
ncbi:tetratricopeptide repeat protein [bacterium]|nr:tetratricopeptide repeat protein [bacterium]